MFNIIHFQGMGDLIIYLEGLKLFGLVPARIFVYQDNVYKFAKAKLPSCDVIKFDNKILGLYYLVRYKCYISHRVSINFIYRFKLYFCYFNKKNLFASRRFLKSWESVVPAGHNARKSILHIWDSLGIEICGKIKAVSISGGEMYAGQTSNLVIAPGTGAAQSFKRWPNANYIKLIKKIKNKYSNVSILIMLGPDEIAMSRDFQEVAEIAEIVVNPSFSDVDRFINRETIFISSDCGMAHYASMNNARLITLFGPTNINKSRPLASNFTPMFAMKIPSCAPCVTKFIADGCCNPVCMQDIDFSNVYNEVCRFLKN